MRALHVRERARDLALLRTIHLIIRTEFVRDSNRLLILRAFRACVAVEADRAEVAASLEFAVAASAERLRVEYLLVCADVRDRVRVEADRAEEVASDAMTAAAVRLITCRVGVVRTERTE